MCKGYEVGGLFPIVLYRRKTSRVLASNVVIHIKKNYNNIIAETCC